MSLLSRRRCMLHEEKQWDYEWYPDNESNEFKVKKVAVNAGDKLIINYYALENNRQSHYKYQGYVYDARDIESGFAKFNQGSVTLVGGSDATTEFTALKDGVVTFCGYRLNENNTYPVADTDVFTGKYIKVKIKR